MRRTLLPAALLCCLAPLSVGGAGTAALGATADPGALLPEVSVQSADDGGLRLVLELPGLEIETIERAGQAFRLAAIPGGELDGLPGQPALPSFTRLVAIPARAGVALGAVEAGDREQLRDIHLLPSQDPAVAGDFAYDDAAYSRRGFDRAARPLVSIGAPALLRDLRVVPVTFRPVRYDPAARTLEVTHRLEVELRFTGAGARAALPAASAARAQRVLPESFDRLYRELVVNYPGPPPGVTVAPGTYLLICSNSTSVTDRLQPLVEWRQRKGATVRLATTAETGTSRSSIKSFIQNVYDTADPPLEYVCLAGDASGTYSIPTWYENLSGYSGEGDHPYTQLAGGDVLADVHIGRLSFDGGNLTELERIVQKTVGYESTPYMQDTGWYTRGCMVGDPASSGQSVVIANQWVKHRLIEAGYTEVDTVFSGSFVSQMTTALNQGDTFFGYRGWLGMSGWSNGNTYALQNGWRLPFAVIMTCGTGSFGGGTARSEGFLRAWNTGQGIPAGGIGSIGTATTGTHTRYNNCMYYGVFHGMLQEGQHTMGAALTRGKLEMYLNYNLSEPSHVTIWSYWNNLMGDPAVDIWTAVPAQITVDHPASIALGANLLPVSVESGGTPLAGARVCAWKGAEIFAVGTTDTHGAVSLPLATATAGDLLLTVSKHDVAPYLATIPVAPETIFVGYAAAAVDDDGSGSSAGNGDGLINPGESIELRVQLHNSGSATATGVTATLTSTDPYVTITDGSESFGDLGAGASAWCADDFDFTVGTGCPHDHTLRFELVASSATDSWSSLVTLDAVAAALVENGLTLYNDGGNGRLDPGETVELSVALLNDGGATASGVNGTLRSLSPYVTITDPDGSFGTIPIGGTGENTADHFGVAAALSAYEGHLASFELTTDFSGGITDTTLFTLPIGLRSSDDPVGPDRYGYLAFDDTDTAYPDAPSYQWVELDPAYGGSGTEVVLGDYGNYQDKVRIVDLPFSFQYYGTLYDQATVCSNGWLAMGTTYLTNYRNWTIPGAGGPDAMLAPFWDDLHQSGGAKVWRQYDAANHRWILEWSHLQNDYGEAETFELLLDDPAFHPTGTGDGIIVFQYQSVTNYDPVNGYATVGIESPDQTDGLLYTYWNQYAGGAASLTAGRAIKFLPLDAQPMGVVEGTVYNASAGNTPLAGAVIEVLDAGRIFQSGSDGRYGGTVAPGTYTVTAYHQSFAPDSAFGVVVRESETTTVDFHLIDNAPPVITTTQHPSTDNTAGPYPIPVTLEEYSGLDAQQLYYRTNGSALTPLPLVQQSGDQYLAQIPGQPYTTLVEYYVYARDSLGLEAVDPPGAPAALYSFLVAPMETIVEDPFEAASGWTAGVAGDDATTGIWERVDPIGTWQGSDPVQPEDDHTPDPGVMCFVTGNGTVGGAVGDSDVDGGKTTLLSPVFDLTGYEAVELSYWVWYSNDLGNNPGEDSWVVDVTADGSTWIGLENTTQSTNGWEQRTFSLSEFIELSGQVQLRFVASDYGGGSLVEAGVDDYLLRGIASTVGLEPAAAATPPRFGLDPCRPNPFNPSTTISYRLAAPGRATLRIFDVAGRLVRVLVDAPQVAGEYAVRWDGRNATGRPLASGVYFMRLETPGFMQVRQMTLLR